MSNSIDAHNAEALFSGQMIERQVQEGLWITAYDICFKKDMHIAGRAQNSIFCGVPLKQTNFVSTVNEEIETNFKTGQSFLMGFGDDGYCETNAKQGDARRVGGIRIESGFVDKLASDHSDSAYRYLVDAVSNPMSLAFHATNNKLAILAEAMLGNSYTGVARDMFLESCALAMTAEFAHLGTITKDQNTSLAPTLKQRKRAELAKEIIDQTLQSPLSTSKLAKMVGINATSLREDFSAAFGITIFDYMQSNRMGLAHELIAGGGLSISQVAYKVGFSSASAFSTAFKRQFGYPPKRIMPKH